MTRKRIFIILAFCTLMLTLGFQWVRAQERIPALPEEPQAPDAAYLGAGFTYQGTLSDSGGNPITDICDFSFTLWSDPVITLPGAQVGFASLVSGVEVEGGHFAALVNAGDEFTDVAFFGHRRWLEIAVQCSGDPGFTTLSPRQEMTATPYAHSLRPGAEIRGNRPDDNSLSVFNFATTGLSDGLYAEATSLSGIAVYGLNTATPAMASPQGGPGGIGVKGEGVTGVIGSGTTIGVSGYSTDGWAIYGYSSAGYAGYFNGNVEVLGDLAVSGTKAFKIDHPLDPANEYLYHYCMESSEVLNEYSGNVVLDEKGEAWVEMPAWFDAVNTDFRYQLTPIGGAAPNLYIASEIQEGRFQIAGGPAGLKVSWQVTALRNDPYLQENPAPVEQAKPKDEAGTYLTPELYGQPAESGLGYSAVP